MGFLPAGLVPHAVLVQLGPLVRRLTHLVVGGRRCPGSTYWVNVRGRWVEGASGWVCLPPDGLRLLVGLRLAGVDVGLVGR